MKKIVAILLTALLAYVSGLFLPWWGIAIAALIVALIVRQAAGRAFLSGLLGVFLLWSGLALWIDTQNGSILSQRIAHILPLGGSNVLLIIVTGLVGGLVAGFAAMCGSYLRPSAVKKRKY